MAVNPEQLQREATFEASSPIGQLLADLDEIGRIVARLRAERSRQTKRAGLTMLAGVAGVIAGKIVGISSLTFVSVLTVAGGFVWWIYLMASKGKLLSHPQRLQIAHQRLSMIRQDASEKSSFSLRLALSSRPTQVSDGKWSARKNGRQQFLEESWMTLEGTMLDGTTVRDEITELTRKRTYSNARGKRKTKSRVTHLVVVRFAYPKEVYGDATAAGHALQKDVRVGSSAALRSVRVTEKAIVMKAMVTAEPEILPTTGMLSVGAYRILNLARRMAAGQRGNAK